MDDNAKNNIISIKNILSSIDNLLIDGKEHKLKAKLGRQIKDSIFTEEILSLLNECDFTGIADEKDKIVKLFESIFPIFITNEDSIFRLYKHKIEVDLSDEMRDRYIYIFSDGRLTSGLFQCYSICDDEYIYGVKRIIDIIPLLKKELEKTLLSFQANIDIRKYKLNNFKDREMLAEKNYNDLYSYLINGKINNKGKK